MFKKTIVLVLMLTVISTMLASCAELLPRDTEKNPFASTMPTKTLDESSNEDEDQGGCLTEFPIPLEEFYSNRKPDDYYAFVAIEDIFPGVEGIESKVDHVNHIDPAANNHKIGYKYDFDGEFSVCVHYLPELKEKKLSDLSNEYFKSFSDIGETYLKKSVYVIQNIGDDEIRYSAIYKNRIYHIDIAIDDIMISFYIPSYYSSTEGIENADELIANDPCYPLIKALMSEGEEREEAYALIKSSVLENIERGNPEE